MTFSLSSTEEERGQRYVDLRTRIIQIKKKYNLPVTDGRVQILNNIGWATMSIFTRLNMIIFLNKNLISESTFRGLIGLVKGDLKTPMEADLLFVRLSFIALFQFQLETLLKIILSKLLKD